MAKQQLPTNFKDDVLAAQMVGKRRYRVIQNEDGTISLEDVTNYSQIGSNFGAAQTNATNLAVNESFDKNKVIDSLADIVANEATGYAAGALAVRELNGNIHDAIYVAEYTLDNKSLAANTTEFFDVTVPVIDGYSRLNYEVSIFNATSNGANSSFCTLYQSVISGGVVRCGIRNNASVNAKIRITVRMSYVKNELVKVR